MNAGAGPMRPRGWRIEVRRSQAKSVGFAGDCQLEGGATGLPPEVTTREDTICEPFICHSISVPVVLRCRKMPAWPTMSVPIGVGTGGQRR